MPGQETCAPPVIVTLPAQINADTAGPTIKGRENSACTPTARAAAAKAGQRFALSAAEKAGLRALLVLTGLALAWAPMIVHAGRPARSKPRYERLFASLRTFLVEVGGHMPDFIDDDANGAAPGTESRWWHRLGRSFVSADSYGLVLLLVVVTYVVSASVTEQRAASVVLAVQLATVWLTLRTSQARRGVRLLADIVLGLAAVVVVVSLFVHNPGDQLGGIFSVCCLLYLIAPFSILRHLILRRQIDTETLLGAVAAYLLIGMFFAFVYKAAGEFGSVPFFGSAGDGTLSQDLFFSFVTMTTVGYGNLVPAANPGQTFAVLEAVTGQLFLVVAVGKIISSMQPRRG